MLTAADIMAGPVTGLPAVAPVDAVLRALRATTHNGFPVFQRDSSSSRVHLEGMVLRSQLLVLLERRAFCKADGEPLAAVDVSTLDRDMALFYSSRFKHRRHLISSSSAVDAILVDWLTGAPRVLAASFLPLYRLLCSFCVAAFRLSLISGHVRLLMCLPLVLSATAATRPSPSPSLNLETC